jgi:hypothetical protein
VTVTRAAISGDLKWTAAYADEEAWQFLNSYPPRSNPPRRSLSGSPGPWYTPSTLSIIEAVSFMVIAPSHRVEDPD